MAKQDSDNGVSKVDELINSTFDKIKDIVDTNTVIGKIIRLSDNIFIVPVSKVSVGILSGGGNIPTKKQKNNVTMGSSSGFTITPIGFVTISGSVIDFVSTTLENSTGKLIDTILNVYEKIVLKNSDNEIVMGEIQDDKKE